MGVYRNARYTEYENRQLRSDCAGRQYQLNEQIAENKRLKAKIKEYENRERDVKAQFSYYSQEHPDNLPI